MHDSVLKWHGGKSYLAEWIISFFPKHIHYVEPFFGGGNVLLSKPCENVSEVVNDLNGVLMNFWKVLGSKELFHEFRNRIEIGTPFAEELFDNYSTKLPKTYEGETDVDLAVMFFVVNRQSRQGGMKSFATLSRNRTRRKMNEQVSSWLSSIENLPEFHDRISSVVMLNRDALKVIASEDGPDTLFYLDPPYLHETRVSKELYAHEMSNEQHENLLRLLEAVEGKFVLSGYHNELYTNYATKNNWRIETKEIDNKASSKKEKDTEIEVLYLNF